MLIRMIALSTVAALAVFPRIALADGDGAVTGAAGGAITGAVIGGPVGAAVGGVAGAIVGGIATDQQPRFRHYVVEERRPSYQWRERVAIGAELPEDVTYWEVPPEYRVRDFRYTVVNDEPVLVDPRTRRIVQIVGPGDERVQDAREPDEGIVMERQERFRQFVEDQRHPSYQWSDRVAVGAELPEGVPYWEVPAEYGVRNYRYTVVNGAKVLVDPHTRRIVQVIANRNREDSDANQGSTMRREGQAKHEERQPEPRR